MTNGKPLTALLLIVWLSAPVSLGQGREDNQRRRELDIPRPGDLGGDYRTSPGARSGGNLPSPSPPAAGSGQAGGSRGSAGVAPPGGGHYNEFQSRYFRCRGYLDELRHNSLMRHDWRHLDSCALFFSRLWLLYNLPPSEYLWRYAHGDSPLTPEVLRVALQDSSQAAASLVRLVGELQMLVDDYEADRLPSKEFESLVDKKTSEIRDLAEQIRDDENLKYIDQRMDVKITSPATGRSIAGLKALILRLKEAATQMQEGISSFYEQDLTRVVGAQELQKPSFKSISENIEKLAKAIENSADRL